MGADTGSPETASSERILEALRDCDALLEGHFLLSSGRHASRYIQCARLLQHPERAAAACAELAEGICIAHGDERPCDVVVGPALGAVTLAYEMARALGVRGLFAERDTDGGFTLRRGLRVEAGERVLVVEDVVTTGRSVREVLDLLRGLRARPVGVAAIVNRSGRPNPFGELPFYRLADLEVPSWEAEACPLCREGNLPLMKPGSRPDLA